MKQKTKTFSEERGSKHTSSGNETICRDNKTSKQLNHLLNIG